MSELPESQRWQKGLGLWLMISAGIAGVILLAITFQMFNAWLGSGGRDWVYAASWVNAILGAYAWTAFWVGVLLHTQYSRLRLLAGMMLVAGVLIAAISVSEEVAKGGLSRLLG